MNPRTVCVSLVAIGLMASAVVWACPESKDNANASKDCGVRTSQPPADQDAVLASNTSPDAVEPPNPGPVNPLARFRDGDSPLDRPARALMGSGPRGGLRLSTERLARSPEKKPAPAAEASRTTKRVTRRTTDAHVAKPHRMPSPELL